MRIRTFEKNGILNDQTCPKQRVVYTGLGGEDARSKVNQEYNTFKTGKKSYAPVLVLGVLTIITIIGGIASYTNRNNEQFLVNKCLTSNHLLSQPTMGPAYLPNNIQYGTPLTSQYYPY